MTSLGGLDVHPAHAAGVAAHRAGVVLAEPDGQALLGDHQDLVALVDPAHGDELVVVADLDRDDAVGLDRRVVRLQLGLLDRAALRREQEVLGLAVVARREHRLDPLALAQRQHVAEVPALGLARRRVGQVVDLRAVDLAAVGEEQQVVVGRGDEEVLDVVLVLHPHPGDADPAAALLAVGGQRQRLDVAGLGDRDHHLLVLDEVLDVEVVLGERDLRAPVVAVALADLAQLVLDQLEHLVLVAEQLAQLARCARPCRRARA